MMRTVKVMFAMGWKRTKLAPPNLGKGYHNEFTVSEITSVPDELSDEELISLWDYCAPDVLGKHSFHYFELLDAERTKDEDYRVAEHNKGDWTR